MNTRLQSWMAMLLALALALLGFQPGLAATTPENLTPTRPIPGWTGTEWTLLAASDTQTGEYICVDFAIRDSNGGLSNHVKYRGVYSYSNNSTKVFSFLITPPEAFQDVQSPNSITYQFYVITSSAGGNCYANTVQTGSYTGYIWSFTWNKDNDPSAVRLVSLDASPQQPWLFGAGVALGLAVLVGSALVLRKRRS